MAIDILDILLDAKPFTLGPSPPPVAGPDVCLDVLRTRFVYLTASTDHARECDGGDPVACAALTQTVQTPPGGVQVWEYTMPSAYVPIGGIGSWTILVGISQSQNSAAVDTETATVTNGGTPDVEDATFEITVDTGGSNFDDFTFGSQWAWSAWRTDTDNEELLASGSMLGMSCVTVF